MKLKTLKGFDLKKGNFNHEVLNKINKLAGDALIESEGGKKKSQNKNPQQKSN